MMLSRHALLAIAAVVDVALHARPGPVAAKALAGRLGLPPRHLETLLQSLVRAGILKGVRGPRGGYELARERRRITAGEVVRAILLGDAPDGAAGAPAPGIVRDVVGPLVETANRSFLDALDAIPIETMCRKAAQLAQTAQDAGRTDFTI